LNSGSQPDEPDDSKKDDEADSKPEPDDGQQSGSGSSSGASGGQDSLGAGTTAEPPPPTCHKGQVFNPQSRLCEDKHLAWYVRWKWQLTGLGVLLLLAVPRLLRVAIRRRRWVVAAAGDSVLGAEVAWRELRDDALDLGFAFPAARTPRRTAADLASDATLSTVPAAELALLAQTLERSRYSREGSAVDARRLRTAVLAIRRGLQHKAGPMRRIRAMLLPASLLPWLRGKSAGAFAPGMGRRALARTKHIVRTRSFKTS
jgi:hypothetical protein